VVPRYLSAAALGALVTFGLFFIMQALVSIEDARVGEALKTQVIDFVRLKREEQIQEKEREKPELEKPDDAPPPPPMDMSRAQTDDASGAGGLLDSISLPGADGSGLDILGAVDSEAIPLVRIEPTYPPRAAEKGVEGWVEVAFTVTARGTVENPVVTAYHPSTIFNNAALQAVRRWKYNPKVVNGKPVPFESKAHFDFSFDES